jgi:hypothetical protein
MPLPNRWKLLKLKLLPMCTVSRMLRQLPNRACPYMLMALPNRAKLRRLHALPNETKSKRLIDDPIWLQPYTLRLEPRRRK